ncbi:hypothetical protein DH2020_011043 [Rehmannia glutinosa]|uniref:Uncharacterized protein n=1 Tax=Rehmannia glutinosa TaxID=99300 RepID=A0ABR0XC93_REHGL
MNNQPFTFATCAGKRYSKRACELICQVNMMLDHEEMDAVQQLEFIDDLQRLGISYLFEDKIDKILNRIYDEDYFKNYQRDNLYATALGFKLLRQHGFSVSQDVFDIFKNEMGEFKPSLGDETKGLLELYEASFLLTQAEKTLDLAREFVTNLLKKKVNIGIEDEHFSLLVHSALDLPLHWRIPRIHAIWCIDAYEMRQDMNPIVLELAKLDFNIAQASQLEEIKHVLRTYLIEAEWYSKGYTPTLEEYMSNGWISIAAHVILTHAFFFYDKSIEKDVVQSLYKYHDIVRYAAIILRFANDLGTSALNKDWFLAAEVLKKRDHIRKLIHRIVKDNALKDPPAARNNKHLQSGITEGDSGAPDGVKESSLDDIKFNSSYEFEIKGRQSFSAMFEQRNVDNTVIDESSQPYKLVVPINQFNNMTLPMEDTLGNQATFPPGNTASRYEPDGGDKPMPLRYPLRSLRKVSQEISSSKSPIIIDVQNEDDCVPEVASPTKRRKDKYDNSSMSCEDLAACVVEDSEDESLLCSSCLGFTPLQLPAWATTASLTPTSPGALHLYGPGPAFGLNLHNDASSPALAPPRPLRLGFRGLGSPGE